MGYNFTGWEPLLFMSAIHFSPIAQKHQKMHEIPPLLCFTFTNTNKHWHYLQVALDYCSLLYQVGITLLKMVSSPKMYLIWWFQPCSSTMWPGNNLWLGNEWHFFYSILPKPISTEISLQIWFYWAWETTGPNFFCWFSFISHGWQANHPKTTFKECFWIWRQWLKVSVLFVFFTMSKLTLCNSYYAHCNYIKSQLRWKLSS